MISRCGPSMSVATLLMCLAIMPGGESGAANSAGEKDKAHDGAWDSATHVNTMQQQEIDERFRQAVIMLHAGKYDYAVTALHRVLELSPDMPEAHVNMGFALLGQGHPGVARNFFLGAIELRPRQANAYWGLAVSLEELCDLKGATGAMRTYLHLADVDDRFLGKARAAIWEWEAAAGTAAVEQEEDGSEPAAKQQAACTVSR